MLSLRQLILLKNSLILAGGTTILSVAFGLPLAFLIERIELPFKKIIRLLIPVPLLIPPYLHAIAWRFILTNFQFSIFNFQFSSTALYNLPAAILIMSFAYFPIVTLLTMFALKNIDARLEEAGELIYSKRRVWQKITLPLILPAVASGAFFVFILSITNFGLPSLLHVNVFTFEIFSQFSAFFNFGKAMILSWPLIVIVIGLLVISYQFVLKGKPVIVVSSGTRSPRPIQTAVIVRIFALSFIVFLLSVSVFLPIVSFLIQTENINTFVFAFKSSSSAIFKSLFLAGLGATIITGAAFVIRNIFRLATLLFLVFPSITIGVVLIKIFNRPCLEVFYTSFGIIIAGYLIRFFPYASEILRTFFAQIDKKLIEAAKLTGASNLQALRKVLIPLLTPGLIAAWLVSFILCLTELGTTILIQPPGWQTLPIRIFVLMHYGAPELVAALCLILIVITVIPFGFLLCLPAGVLSSAQSHEGLAGKGEKTAQTKKQSG
ncbi:MAG: iron ABC transporter permease [Candidatus Cloacimonetes bacterium]|nr:iron ABC transporter permease [Candidatus Cloacimonadota bacterium]